MEAFWEWLRPVLLISSILLVFVAVYRWVMNKRGKATTYPAVLYPLEPDVVSGNVRFFFEVKEPHKFTFQVIDQEATTKEVLLEEELTPGQYPVDLDTTQLPDGVFFYEILTDGDKTSRRFTIRNKEY